MYSCAPWLKAAKPLPSPKIWTKYIYPPKKGHNDPNPTKYDPQTLDPPFFKINFLTLPKKLWFLESMKRPWPPKSFENDFYPPKNTKNHENGPYPHKNEEPPPLWMFLTPSLSIVFYSWNVHCIMRSFLTRKKFVNWIGYSMKCFIFMFMLIVPIKTKYCEYILSQFTHFLPSEVMSIQFLLFSYSPLQWLFNFQYLYKRLSQLLQ